MTDFVNPHPVCKLFQDLADLVPPIWVCGVGASILAGGAVCVGGLPFLDGQSALTRVGPRGLVTTNPDRSLLHDMSGSTMQPLQLLAFGEARIEYPSDATQQQRARIDNAAYSLHRHSFDGIVPVSIHFPGDGGAGRHTVQDDKIGLIVFAWRTGAISDAQFAGVIEAIKAMSSGEITQESLHAKLDEALNQVGRYAGLEEQLVKAVKDAGFAGHDIYLSNLVPTPGIDAQELSYVLDSLVAATPENLAEKMAARGNSLMADGTPVYLPKLGPDQGFLLWKGDPKEIVGDDTRLFIPVAAAVAMEISATEKPPN